MAYARVEPFGQTRDNWHAALLCSLIYAANRDKRSRELGPQDFMWEVRAAHEEESAANRDARIMHSLKTFFSDAK